MYRWVFTIVGAAAIALGLLLLVRPDIYFAQYLAMPDTGAAFAGRRLAAAVMALGAILLLTRNLPAGGIACGIAWIGALTWFVIAATGILSYVNGVAGGNILLAAASEIILGGLFALAARAAR